MDCNTLLTTVFCLIDDWLKTQPRVRQRGPQPTVSDSEVLTIEVVGALLGIATDKGLYEHFCRHYSAYFPTLRTIHRTTFTRQMANLWRVKEQLWQYLLTQVTYDETIAVIDSFPLPVCRFGRAYRSKRLREWSAWGYDDVNRQPFFGLRAHAVICWPGVIVGLALHPADIHDRWVADDLLVTARPGWAIGDTNYWSPLLYADLRQHGVSLVTPRKTSLPHQSHSWPRWLIQTRRRIETVISQLTERYRVKRIWVHDSFHLCARWLRYLVSHTLAVFLAQQVGLASPLRFAELLSD